MRGREKPVIHGRDHEPGGADPIRFPEDLVGGGMTIQDEGTELTARTILNFVGDGVTAADDAANTRTNVTIPGGGGGAGALTYGAATAGALSVAAGFSDYLSFVTGGGTIHSSGVTISGSTVTIITAGTYGVQATGYAQIDGPATLSGGIGHLQMMLELNGASPTPNIFATAISPVDVPAGRSWGTTLSLLGQYAFSASDALKFQGVNATPVSAGFSQWSIVVLRLA